MRREIEERELDRRLAGARPREAASWVVERLGAIESPSRAERFLIDAVTLALHRERAEDIDRWLEAFRERHGSAGGSRRRVENVAAALCMASRLAQRRDREARAAQSKVEWSAIDDAPPFVNLHLLWLLHRSRYREALLLLGRSRAVFREPYDLGNRLRILAGACVHAGAVARGLGYCRAALRHLARDPRPRARYLEIEARGHRARLLLEAGRVEEARQECEGALAAARRWRHALYRRGLSIDLAGIHLYEGDHRRARRVLSSVPARPADGAAAAFALVRLFQARCEVAVEAGRPAEAERWIDAALALLAEHPHERLEAWVRVSRGRARLLDRAPAALEAAQEELAGAEAAFRRLGERGRHGLAAALVARGHLHLLREELAPALACCREGLALARETRLLVVQASGLRLQSALLARGAVPEPVATLEEILRGLGVIRDPVLLFRVLANLYVHSWDRAEGLDLSASHLRRLHGLRGALGEARYRQLYRSEVTRRILPRLFDRLGGSG